MTERLLLAVAIVSAILLVAALVRAWSAARIARLAATTRVDAAGLPSVMLFTSSLCDACVTQKRIVEELAPAWRNRVQVAQVDAVEQARLARRLGIVMVPAVVVAASDGRVVGIRQGLVDADRLRSMIEAAS